MPAVGRAVCVLVCIFVCACAVMAWVVTAWVVIAGREKGVSVCERGMGKGDRGSSKKVSDKSAEKRVFFIKQSLLAGARYTVTAR